DRDSVASPRARHQNGFAIQESRVRVGASLEKPFDDRGVAVDAGQVEGRGTGVVRGIRACTRTNQEIDGVEVVEMNGPVERGGAVALGGVDVDVLSQQPGDTFEILALDRLYQPQVTIGGDSGGERQHDNPRARQRPHDDTRRFFLPFYLLIPNLNAREHPIVEPPRTVADPIEVNAQLV